MVLAQLINAAGVDGTAQELVYFILRVQSILGTPAEGRGHGFTRCMSIAMGEAMRREGHRQHVEEGYEHVCGTLLPDLRSRGNGTSTPHNPVPDAGAFPPPSPASVA